MCVSDVWFVLPFPQCPVEACSCRDRVVIRKQRFHDVTVGRCVIWHFNCDFYGVLLFGYYHSSLIPQILHWSQRSVSSVVSITWTYVHCTLRILHCVFGVCQQSSVHVALWGHNLPAASVYALAIVSALAMSRCRIVIPRYFQNGHISGASTPPVLFLTSLPWQYVPRGIFFFFIRLFILFSFCVNVFSLEMNPA